MRALALTLTFALLLAGCANKGGEEPLTTESATIEDGDTAATPASPAPSSPSPGSPSKPSSGPSKPTAVTPTTSTPPAQNASGPTVVTVEGDTGAAAAVGAPDPVGSAAVGLAFADLALPRASPRNATLVATWESASPLDASMDVYLRDADGNLIASGSGASPLTIEIPGEAFAAATELEASAFPPQGGVAAEYSVHLALTLTYA